MKRLLLALSAIAATTASGWAEKSGVYDPSLMGNPGPFTRDYLSTVAFPMTRELANKWYWGDKTDVMYFGGIGFQR